jgi:Flp pilus assembly protein TadG
MKMKSFFVNERGQALILIALAAIGLVGIVGLAVDGTAKFSDRRHAQNAADTAAMAAALEKTNGMTFQNQTGTDVCSTNSGESTLNTAFCWEIIWAAWNQAQANGYMSQIPNRVDVYSPPKTGPYTGNTAYVQVRITSYVNTYFSRVIRVAQTRNIVEAVALTGKGRTLGDGAMIVSYDADPNCSVGGTGGYSVQVNGSATVNLDGGGFLLNSDETCGFKIPNCADLNLTHGASINTVGANNIDTTGCTFDPPVNKNFNEAPIAIPNDVDWPDVPAECGMTPQTPNQLGTALGTDNKWHEEWMIYPGFYTDFPQPALVSNKSFIYMHEGVYCIDPPGTQDLTWSSVDAAMLTGATSPSKNKYYGSATDGGVTLYIKAGGGFGINATSPTILDATNDPNSKYQGYLIILEGTHTSHPSCTINGGADIYLNGLIYAPYCDFIINGQAGETSDINAQLIGWDIKINGDNAINFYYNPDNAVKIKRKVGLMR